MKYANLIASMESAMEQEVQYTERPVTDNIMTSVPEKTTVKDGDVTGPTEVIIETNPTDEITIGEEVVTVPEEPVAVAVNQITQDLDDLGMVKTALESYETILNSMMDKDGELSAAVMLAVNKGLECFGISPIEGKFVSLEDYPVANTFTRQVSSEDFKSSISERISETGKKIAEAFRKFIEWIQNFYRAWMANGAKKVKQVRELRDRVSKANKFDNPTIRNPRAMMVGDKFVLNDESAFNEACNMFDGVMRFVAENAPKIAGGYTMTVTRLLKAKGGVSVDQLPKEELININNDYIRETSGYLGRAMHKGRNELDTDNDYMTSNAYPGNYYFYVENREYAGIPYIHVGFDEGRGGDIPEEVQFMCDSQRAKHYVEALTRLTAKIESYRKNVDNLERTTVWSLVGVGDNSTAFVRMIKGLMGEIAPIIGQFDRFFNATCKCVERAIVE